MNSILPFTSAISGASSPSHFIVLDTDAPDGGHFLSITPKVMRWNENTYILDLSPVTAYWNHLAEQEGLSFTEFLPQLLAKISHPPKRIVLADHPWKALVALGVTMSRPMLSYIDTQSHLGRRILHEATWSQWIELCYELREHLLQKTGKNVQGSCSSLAKTVERMRLTHISQMSDMETTAMQRRFGKLIATAWDWTWKQTTSFSLFDRETFMESFPWINLTTKDVPNVTRHIEVPLKQWDHIAPLLCEDLDKLCNLTCWNSSERVVSLEWMLSFSCSPSLRIPVLFRHPHALHRESGHHKTALLQAFYSWQNATKSRLPAEINGETYISDDSIIEWTLLVQERLIISPQVRSLFQDDLSTETSQLRLIENSLPVPLIGYGMTEHWSPEKSFEKVNASSPEIKTIPFGSIAKLGMYQRRPLFIYENPEPLTQQHQSSGMIFCERIATSWWSHQPTSATSTCRNYYIRMTDDGLLQWVFQNDDGTLCLQGMYG